MNKNQFKEILLILIQSFEKTMKEEGVKHDLNVDNVGHILDEYMAYIMARLAGIAKHLDMPDDKLISKLCDSISHALKNKIAINEEVEGVY